MKTKTGTKQQVFKKTGKKTGEKLEKPDYSMKDPDYKWGLFDKKNKQHMTVLSRAQEMGWTVWCEKRQRYIADLNRIGRFLKNKKAKINKPLIKQTRRELSTTIEQLSQISLKHFKNKCL